MSGPHVWMYFKELFCDEEPFLDYSTDSFHLCAKPPILYNLQLLCKWLWNYYEVLQEKTDSLTTVLREVWDLTKEAHLLLVTQWWLLIIQDNNSVGFKKSCFKVLVNYILQPERQLLSRSVKVTNYTPSSCCPIPLPPCCSEKKAVEIFRFPCSFLPYQTNFSTENHSFTIANQTRMVIMNKTMWQ